jgi:hypothetical protein
LIPRGIGNGISHLVNLGASGDRNSQSHEAAENKKSFHFVLDDVSSSKVSADSQ